MARRQAAYVDEVDRLVRAAGLVMARTESIAPRVSEILGEAGLSNQAFYRHFRSRDELLVAVLDDGVQQLVTYLSHLMAKETSGLGRVRRWIEGILAQASRPTAAGATRPFVLHRLRLADQFPDETRRSEEALRVSVRAAIADAAAQGELATSPTGDFDRDAEAIYHLAMGQMQSWVIQRYLPTRDDVDHVVRFGLAGLALDDSERSRRRGA